MRYYVLWPDGRKFGPADVPTLNQWIAEGRVHADMTLEDANTGQRILARDVGGLVFLNTIQQPQQYQPGSQQAQQHQQTPYQPSANQFQNPPQPFNSPYPRGGAPYVNPNLGSAEFTWSLVCSIAGFLFCCCFPLPAVGVYLGNRAKNLGHPSGNAAVVVGWVLFGIGVAYWVLRIIALMAMSSQFPGL